VKLSSASSLTAAAVLALAASLAAADVKPGVFGVGVLRRDGIIVPFATYDGKRWADRWPVPDVQLDVPIALRDVPSKWWGPTRALAEWQSWATKEPQTLRVVQPDWIDVHCTRQIGLRTDYKPDELPPPRTVQPYPKDGLVVSPPQPVERIAIVSPDSQEVRTAMPALREAFNQAERSMENQYGHPIPRRSREGHDPEVEAIYAVGEHPRIYHVETSRRYRLLGQKADDCEAIAFGTGWFAADGAQVSSLYMRVDLLNCDKRGASYMLPLGAMRLRGSLYWLAQYSGWDDERYVVVEIKEKSVKVVLNTWGGSC
jgi:hypothetical protein